MPMNANDQGKMAGKLQNLTQRRKDAEKKWKLELRDALSQ